MFIITNNQILFWSYIQHVVSQQNKRQEKTARAFDSRGRLELAASVCTVNVTHVGRLGRGKGEGRSTVGEG